MSESRPIVILIGPSGVGKSTILDRLVGETKGLRDVITFTTRSMRVGEAEGQPYHFVAKEKFKELLAQEFFVEHAEVHGNLYGTPRNQILAAWAANEAVIMDVDVKGALKLRLEFPQALTIFIRPPSIDALRHRLLGRDGKAIKDLDLRLKNAEQELNQAGLFAHQVMNDHREEAFITIKNLIEDYLGTR